MGKEASAWVMLPIKPASDLDTEIVQREDTSPVPLRGPEDPPSRAMIAENNQIFFSQVFSKSFYQCQVNSRLVTILTRQVFFQKKRDEFG